jgi:hypothetical protein
MGLPIRPLALRMPWARATSVALGGISAAGRSPLHSRSHHHVGPRAVVSTADGLGALPRGRVAFARHGCVHGDPSTRESQVEKAVDLVVEGEGVARH